MRKRFGGRKHIMIMATLAIALFICAFAGVYADTADNGIPDDYEIPKYNDIPAQQFKDVFETETMEISDIEVNPDSYPDDWDMWNDTIHFRIFNSTTQETECEVDTINDGGIHTLPALNLKKNHNYIFFVEDPWYTRGTHIYVQILDSDAEMANAGEGAYNYKYVVNDSTGEHYNKEYEKLTEISVFKRNAIEENPRDDARECIGCTALPVVVTYKGNPVQEKLRFRFVSDVDVRNGSTNYKEETAGQGILYAYLLEDVTYMVYLDSDKYVMDPFPIVVKDKSEYREGLYAYDHRTCYRVDAEYPIKLYDRIEESYDGFEVLSVTSLKKRVTVTGMNFRHLLILDRVLDNSIAPGMSGKDCEVFDVTAVNPHRWEISKLVGNEFTITKKIEHNKCATHVYYIDDEDKLQELPFTQNSADEVSFKTDSLSLYPYVIEFDPDKTYEQAKEEEQAAREEADRQAAAADVAAAEAARQGTPDGSLPNVKISKPKAAKKTITVKWKKLNKKQLKSGAQRIEIWVCPNKGFGSSDTVIKTAGKKKASLKVKGLAKGTYYVKVRAIKDAGGSKLVGPWSKIKKIKVK